MDVIKERIDLGVCPICKEVTIETKAVQHPKHGKVKICKKHYAEVE